MIGDTNDRCISKPFLSITTSVLIMSLFKINTFWDSSPVWQEEENFDFNAFCVNKYATNTKSKTGSILITGSYQGVLRISSPTYDKARLEQENDSLYRSQDLLLETLLPHSILQVICCDYSDIGLLATVKTFNIRTVLIFESV